MPVVMQQRDEPIVLGDGALQIRWRCEVQLAPLSLDGGGILERLPRMFEQHARERANFRLRGFRHVRTTHT